MGGDRIDFFVSHAGADRAWAEWVAWQLAEAGYTVELDVWDWAPGRNFVTAMSDALDRAARVVALFSAAYFDRSRYTTQEWSATVVHVPGAEQGRLVPVRVEEVAADLVPGVLRPLVFCDLFGVDADQARRRLLEAVRGPRRPDGEPVFPGRGAGAGPGRLGGSGPRLPGSVPRVWNIPARNPEFTGRDQMLVTLRDVLTGGDRAVVQALHGMGGVGKTQLAAEYAWRFAGAYELGWWVDAEQGGLIGDQFAALGAALDCVEAGAHTAMVRDAVLGELRERGRWLLVFDNAQAPGDLALHSQGRYAEARDLGQDFVARARRVLGDDHENTLAAGLRALGELQAARDLDQDTLDRRRRVLGEHHPETLQSAHNLAADLRALGEADDGAGG